MRGSIIKRGASSWTIIVSDGSDPETGKRRQIWRSVTGSKKDAQRLLTELLHQRDRGMMPIAGRLTFGEHLRRWLTEVAGHVRPTTAKRYRELIGHVIAALGSRRLEQVRARDLESVYVAKLGEGLAPQTVGHLHRAVHKALSDAVRLGVAPRNVADSARPPKVPSREMTYLAPEEARALLDAAKGSPLHALYVVAVTAGLRQGELLALRWQDIDLASGRLAVRRSIAWIGGRWIEQEPKSAKSRRTIVLTPMAVEALRRHRAAQLEDRVRALAWHDLDLVFPTGVGTPWRPSNLIRRSWRPLLARARLPMIPFHALRHTAATLMLSSGVPVKVVSEHLGHSQIAVTMDTYGHVIPAMREDAARLVEAALSTR